MDVGNSAKNMEFELERVISFLKHAFVFAIESDDCNGNQSASFGLGGSRMEKRSVDCMLCFPPIDFAEHLRYLLPPYQKK